MVSMAVGYKRQRNKEKFDGHTQEDTQSYRCLFSYLGQVLAHPRCRVRQMERHSHISHTHPKKQKDSPTHKNTRTDTHTHTDALTHTWRLTTLLGDL